MPPDYCSHVAYCTTLKVQPLTTSRLTKRSWQSEVELNVIILDVPTFTTSRFPRDPSNQRWNYVGEKWPMNFAWNARLPRSIQGTFLLYTTSLRMLCTREKFEIWLIWDNVSLKQLSLLTPHMLINTWQEPEYRLDICRATTGAHIEVYGRA